MRRRLVIPVAIAALAFAGSAAAIPRAPAGHQVVGFRVLYRFMLRHDRELVRRIWVPYTAWDGKHREALLVLPAWYGRRLDPPIPLVISPHGRGGTAGGNAAYWGDLPAFGPFAVVNPQGQGRRLIAYSWGWRGQISDLARMPSILERRLPWLRIGRHAIYAVGSSMGGQEALLLDALHPHLLAGVVALDSATDLAARWRAFGDVNGGWELRQRMQAEVGGTPATNPRGYAARSPISYVRRLASDRVPLYIWWSTADRVVADQSMGSGRLYRAIERFDPGAPVHQVVGSWEHSAEMRPMRQLPAALVELGLIHLDGALGGRFPRADDSFAVPVRVPGRSMPASLSVPGGVARALAGALHNRWDPSQTPAEAAARVPGWRSSTA
jgi:pimeloyl-ACP methyl ester carboxylesterase